MSYIGIDIGGTTITAISTDGKQLIARAQYPTGPDRDAAAVLHTIETAAREVMNGGETAIGIGVPGIIDLEEGRILKINNIPAFNGFSLRSSVADIFGLPVYLENDANCFVLGECWFGAGRPFSNMVGITLGTGVGGGIVIDRRIYSGNLGAAGEFGCFEYRGGMFEVYGGSQFFEQEYRASGKALYDLALEGDETARRAFLEYGSHLAGLVEKIIYFLAPEAIIIGGSISQAFEYFYPSIGHLLDHFSIPLLAQNVQVLPAALDEAGVYGAAALCMSRIPGLQSES